MIGLLIADLTVLMDIDENHGGAARCLLPHRSAVTIGSSPPIMLLLTVAVLLLTGPSIRFVHEVVYVLAARPLGGRLERFVVGIGPRVFEHKKVEFRLLPIWVFARLERTAPSRARILGALTSLGGAYLGLVLPVFVHMLAAWPTPHLPAEIDYVRPGEPADLAGLTSGDRLVAVNGHAVDTMPEVIEHLSPNATVPVTIEYLRDGEHRRVVVTPANVNGRGMVGIVGRIEFSYEPTAPGTAARNSLILFPRLWRDQLTLFWQQTNGSEPTRVVGVVGLTVMATSDSVAASRMLLGLTSFIGALILLLHLVLPLTGFALHRIFGHRRL